MRGALTYEQLWALRDVSLRVERGESARDRGPERRGQEHAPQGHLARAPGDQRPGRCVHGRVAPILELGSGFDFELTGHENIFLNALLLGPCQAGDRAALRRDRGVQRPGRLHPVAHPQLLVGHAGAARLLDRHGLDAGHPDPRRVPGRGRRALREEVRGADRRAPGARHHPPARLALRRRRSAQHCRRCIWLECGRLRRRRRARRGAGLYEESGRWRWRWPRRGSISA